MAKERSVNMSVLFTMHRDGKEVNSQRAFNSMLKAVQAVLGTKYQVRALIVHEHRPEADAGDMVYLPGAPWPLSRHEWAESEGRGGDDVA